jgi:hypothetical protein
MRRHGAWVVPTDLLLLVMLSACATDAAGSRPHGLGGVRDQSVLATAPPARAGHATMPDVDPAPAAATLVDDLPVTEAMVGPGLERSLRHEVAEAADPAPAALELADLLCSLERHREALAVVDAALQRADAPALRVCRAGLLRDLGRRQQAADALLALVGAHGPAAMHPGLMFECAELQWLAGDAEGAAKTLRSLQEVHAADPWCADNRVALDGLVEEVATRDAPPRVRVRDLLASLRGSGTVPERVLLLSELVALADRETGPRRQHLRSRAIAIACADESPAVRARAVQLAEPAAEDAESFFRAALDDDAALVRRFAAERSVPCAGAAAAPLLLEAIQRESDGPAFRAMHAALAALLAEGPDLPPASETDAVARERVALAWRLRCNP